MSRILLLLLAIAPALALFLPLLRWPQRPVRWPRRYGLVTLLLALVAGAASASLASILEQILTVTPWSIGSLGALAVFSLLVAGITEEGAKYLALRFGAWSLPWFAEPYDGILYGVAVGLGFGTAENILYVAKGGVGTAIVRALTAVPLHAMLGVVLGKYIGDAKYLARRGRKWGSLHLAGVGWAALIHGLYDLFAFQNSTASFVALIVVLLGLVVWCIRTFRRALRASPSWSGRGENDEIPVSSFRPRPQRAPLFAGFLGLFPGVGQFYNGESGKGALLLSAGVLNLSTLAFAWLLVVYPPLPLYLLQRIAGLNTTIPPEQLAKLAGSWALPLSATALTAAFSLFGAYDAYQTARASWQPEVEEKRRFIPRFGPALCASYVVHLLATYLFLLAPVMDQPEPEPASNAAVPPGSLDVDLIMNPETLDGFNKTPEGTADGRDEKSEQREGEKSGQEAETQRQAGAHDGVEKKTPKPAVQAPPKADKDDPSAAEEADATPAPSPKGNKESSKDGSSAGDGATGQQRLRAKGEMRSYNEYLTIMLHQRHDPYFERADPWQHTVVRYTVLADGTVTNVYVLYDHTTAGPAVAELAANQVRRLNPARPLPSGVRSIQVTELFWRGIMIGPPGSLEYRLSRLADGREILPNYGGGENDTKSPKPSGGVIDKRNQGEPTEEPAGTL